MAAWAERAVGLEILRSLDWGKRVLGQDLYRTVDLDGADDPVRVLAYCHDGVGLGHLRRTLNICESLGRAYPGSTYLVATGNPYISFFPQTAGIDYLKMPALRKINNETYAPKFLHMRDGALQRCRQALLLEAAKHFDPDIVLVDKAPVGVCGELAPTLRWVRRNNPGARIVFGMRDIEDEPQATREQWSRLDIPRMLEDYFDEVWVYGMRDVFDVAAEYRLSERVREKLRFTGYVSRRGCTHAVSTRGVSQVLVTIGGGTDGADILGAYLDGPAQHLAETGVRSLVVAGPDLPKDHASALRERASLLPMVEWQDFASCLSCEIRRSKLVVCMGGYNTLCEVVSAGRPALVIPRTRPRLEQAIRARLWERRGLVQVVDRAGLNGSAFAEAIARSLALPSTPTVPLDLGGLDKVCERFGALLNGKAHRAAALRL